MPDKYKVEANRVKGCMSQVWVRAYRDTEHPDLIRYLGDCDTAIIKGVVALVVELLSGRRAKAIRDLDLDGLFQELQPGRAPEPQPPLRCLRYRGTDEKSGSGAGQPGESGGLTRPGHRLSG